MSARLVRPEHSNECSVQVWLSSRRVVWARWSGRRLCCCTSHPIEDLPSDPFVSGKTISLVVDPGNEDVERIASPGFGAGPVGWWQRSVLQRDRRQAGLHGQLHWLGRHGSEVARAGRLIEHWPEVIVRWLELAQQQGLVFEHIVSAPRLIAKHTAARHKVPQLVVYTWAGVRRHVVCADGVVCLSRSIAQDDHPLESAATSLEHVAERWGFKRIDVSLPLVPESWTPEAQTRLESLGNGSVFVRDCASVQTNNSDNAQESLAVDCLLVDLGQKFTTRQSSLWCRSIVSRVPDAESATASTRARRVLLGFSLSAGVSLMLALSFASYALVVGVEHVRQAAATGAERAALLSDISSTRSQAATLEVNPVRASRRVQRAMTLDLSAPMSPAAVAELVATHVTQYPDIVLHLLEWRALRTESDSESNRSMDLLSSERIRQTEATVWQAPLLRQAPEALPTRTLIELAGVVAAGKPVGVAQKRVDAFFESIQLDMKVGSCTLLESPLMQASEGPSKRNSDHGLSFRLRCILEHAQGSILESSIESPSGETSL